MTDINVFMSPHVDDFNDEESGIRRVIEAYFRYLPDYGINLVKKGEPYDLRAVHAGMTGREADIVHLHGMYWTADYASAPWEYSANARIVDALRGALEISVPSDWVAETFARDIRRMPHVIPHGIDINEWSVEPHQGYVLWNKNRNADVCDPTPAIDLARKRPGVELRTTFLPFGMKEKLPNVFGIGLQAHHVMKKTVQNAAVYLSTTKETFGIGVLEAMAAGVPVLGFDWGGNQDLIKHGVSGYLAKPNDIEDLANGLDFCLQHRDTLSDNSRELAKVWNWPDAVKLVADMYKLAMQSDPYEGTTSVVIPCYNYAHSLERAVLSCLAQTHKPIEIIIVDDNSTDNTAQIGRELAEKYETVHYYHKNNGGVATARNYGIERAHGEFICCLDADDKIQPQFIEACVPVLVNDRSIGIAYTGLTAVTSEGSSLSQWPPKEPNYDAHLTPRNEGNLRGLNQIPTCCVFRRVAWERVGGYKQRYAPLGAGAEDAELWARIFALGFGAQQATSAGLFIYSHLSGQVSSSFADGSIDKNLLEPEWLSMHPWATDKEHPLASRATPNRLSHEVRQYDQPDVSIIIPVGPGHEDIVRNALDSVEAQTHRRWEAIVVFDTGSTIESHAAIEKLRSAYPYVRAYMTGEEKGYGAGHARNVGVEHARGAFIVFLDADDSLAPLFLERCFDNWNENQTIAYTDYINKAIMPQESVDNWAEEDVLGYIEKTQEAFLLGHSAPYDCERAQRQPAKTDDFYHWCLVTALIPRAWHNAIGGFDTTMATFEDVLYHWKMARAGYCYTLIPEPLVVYRMYTGNRREIASLYTEEGREVARNMLDYAEQQLERMDTVACKKCPGGRPKPAINVINELANFAEKGVAMETDQNYVLSKYMSANIGNHHIIGAATGTKYRYGKGGDVFLVHREDIAAQPHLFQPLQSSIEEAPREETPSLPVPQSIAVPMSPIMPTGDEQSLGDVIDAFEPPVEGAVPNYIAPSVEQATTESLSTHTTPDNAAPQPIDPDNPVNTYVPPTIATGDEPVDLQAIPGINAPIAKEFLARGLTTKNAIIAIGLAGLEEIPGIGEVRAAGIMSALAIDAREMSK